MSRRRHVARTASLPSVTWLPPAALWFDLRQRAIIFVVNIDRRSRSRSPLGPGVRGWPSPAFLPGRSCARASFEQSRPSTPNNLPSCAGSTACRQKRRMHVIPRHRLAQPRSSSPRGTRVSRGVRLFRKRRKGWSASTAYSGSKDERDRWIAIRRPTTTGRGLTR